MCANVCVCVSGWLCHSENRSYSQPVKSFSSLHEANLNEEALSQHKDAWCNKRLHAEKKQAWSLYIFHPDLYVLYKDQPVKHKADSPVKFHYQQTHSQKGRADFSTVAPSHMKSFHIEHKMHLWWCWLVLYFSF